MEAFCGKWKTTGKMDNVDAYAKALNLTGDQKKNLTKSYTYEVSFSGGVITTVMTTDGASPITHNAKMGEKTKVNMPMMGEVEVISTLQGDTLVTVQTFAAGSQTLRSQVKGGELKVDTTCNGVSMTAYLARA